MKLKPFLFLIASLLLGACASAPDDAPRVKFDDPAVEEQNYKNARLAQQSLKQMEKTLQVPAITYEFDSVRPPEEAYALLDKIAAIMLENPYLHLIVEGHADSVGSAEYNYWLSASRAASVKSYLVSRGINAERIRIHSHGKDRPLTLDMSAKARKINRRVEFTFTKRDWQAIY